MSTSHPQFTARIEGSPETIFDLIADMPNYGRWLPGSEARSERCRTPLGTVTLRLLKQAINEGYGLPLEAGLAVEAKTWAVAFATEDRTEGVAAFLENRTAAFKGR